MRIKLLFSLTLLLFISQVNATVYTTVSAGNWNNNNTWDANGSPGSYWGAGDQVIVNHAVILNQDFGYAGSLSINNPGSLIGNTRSVALYNGATISFSGDLEVNNFTLNSTSHGTHSGTLTVNNNLTVGSNSTLTSNNTVSIANNFNNNSGNVTFNNSVYIGNDFTNNNGTVTFNDEVTIVNKFTNNNSNAVVNINDDFNVGGDVENNSSSTLNVNENGTMNIDGNFTANWGTDINIEGRINTNGNFSNNGGDIDNNGVTDIGGNFTQNGGTFTNNGVMLVDGTFTVNSGGTVDGSGIIRTDQITNYGTISGDNDICSLDESGNPSQSGGGAYSAGTSYCEESASAALPIELDYFKLSPSTNSIKFFWRTLTEINNDYFSIERSKDAKSYEEVLRIDGSGNSSRPIEYMETLSSTQELGGYYYRLKQTDFDGQTSETRAEFVKPIKKNQASFNAYPNPNNGRSLFLEIENVDEKEYKVDLLNSSGVLVKSRMINLEESTQYYEVELLKGEFLPTGIYFLRIANLKERILKKVIVQ